MDVRKNNLNSKSIEDSVERNGCVHVIEEVVYWDY